MSEKSGNRDGKIGEEARIIFTENFNYRFRDGRLLTLALTHSGAAAAVGQHNQRLEFLGDAVLGMIIGEYLYQKFPALTEGELSTRRAAVVSRAAMTNALKRRGLRGLFKLEKGLRERDELPDSIYANIGEALIGAVYLDGGYAAAREVSLALLQTEIAAAENADCATAKMRLQTWAQAKKKSAPVYQLLTTSGQAHQRLHRVGVFIDNQLIAKGDGANKKSAEQNAAENAIAQLRIT